jgi:ABC-type transport system involved in cytochrome c biogenesis permease subunit
MVTALFGLTALLYALSCGLYVSFLARGTEATAGWAARVLGASVVSHLVFLGSNWAHFGHAPTADIHQALAVMSLLVVLVFLVTVRTRARLRVLGAFITPVTLLLFLGAAFRRGVGPVPEEVRSALLPVHVAVNVLGLAAFALAFAAALAYLLQERQLRKKNLGGLFQRLPPLDVLDSLGLKAVLAGFPLLTVGVVTGTIWAVRLHTSAFELSAAQGFGLLAWLLFAAVLLLRVAAGWRGRKAAIGTSLGFLCTVAVLVGYVLRGDGGVG